MDENQRLTPEAFKEIFKARGWSGRALAQRWDVSEAWISKLLNDPDRAPHWDDAVRGLPVLPKRKKTRKTTKVEK